MANKKKATRKKKVAVAKKKRPTTKKRAPRKALKALRRDINDGKFERKMARVMDEFKEGKLKSGSKNGKKVKSRKQAVAIALSEANKAAKRKKSKK